MIKKSFYLIALFVLSFFSCNEDEVIDEFYSAKQITEKNFIYNSIEYETLVLDSVSTSYQGFFHVNNDKLNFLDSRFGWLFIFDTYGNLVDKKFGRGGGPTEISAAEIAYYAIKPNNGYFITGVSWDNYNFSEDYYLKNKSIMDWGSDFSKITDLQKEVNPLDPKMYNLDYDKRAIATDSYVLFPLNSQYQNFNLSYENYFTEGKIFAKMDIETGKINQLIGRRSPFYEKNKNLGLFSSVMIDIYGNDFCFSFETDPTIYVLDKSLKNVKKSFGVSGRNMKMDYPNINETVNRQDLISIGKLWNEGRSSKGYYTSIKYVPERQLLFRTYHKGGKDTDGLQIYNDNIIIADVDVPKGFNVFGYIEPYFYSKSVIDDNDEQLFLYRFKLNE